MKKLTKNLSVLLLITLLMLCALFSIFEFNNLDITDKMSKNAEVEITTSLSKTELSVSLLIACGAFVWRRL